MMHPFGALATQITFEGFSRLFDGLGLVSYNTLEGIKEVGGASYGWNLCILRSGATGANDVDHARVAVATTAKTAKEKCLPVLQANQDVFSYLAYFTCAIQAS